MGLSPSARRWWIGLAVAGGILLAVYLARGRWGPAMATWLDVGGPPRVADVVLLLNGGVNTRPFAAAALVQGGWARRVLIATVAVSAEVAAGNGLPWHEIDRRVLLRCGIPERDIVLLPRDARTTFDEAAALAEFLAAAPDTRVLVVTDGPHTRRARWILTRVVGRRADRLAMVAAPTDEFQPETWWRSEPGLAFVVSEYLKLAFYALRYGYLGYEILAILCLLAALVICFRWRAGRSRRAVDGQGGNA
ncbi:MAG: ElyC/SanA/YdcF family protein [Thermoguttaceae bacterium]|jgi:uncharacterized SAM-binding protein YcdF (DUF218 family)